MSLHNSTNLRTKLDFSLLVDFSDQKLKSWDMVIKITDQKPSEAGFDLRGEAAKQLSVNACVNAGFAERTSTKVKLIRAQGECLGIRSRRRTQRSAKSHGEAKAAIDPWISEWGNPAKQYLVIIY